MKDKLTYIDALNYAMSNCTTLPSDIADKLFNLRDQINQRNSKPPKPTKRQRENINLLEQLYDLMAAHPTMTLSITEWQECYGAPFVDLSNQKVSALMLKLVKQGRVTRVVIGSEPYFKVAIK